MRSKRGVGPIERASKRTRPELGLEYARDAWKSIFSMVLEDLHDPGKSTLLPYPGLEDPGNWPGLEIDFIGSSELKDFLVEVEQVLDGRFGFLQLVGPKGFGKSCLLRAGACVLYRTRPSNIRLICIWNMERCRGSVLKWIKSALLFTYISCDAEVSAIMALDSLDAIKNFLNLREEMGEELVFIVDGAQKADVHKWHGGLRDDSDALAALGADMNSVIVRRRVIWGLTSLAEKVQEQIEAPEDSGIVTYMEGCPEAVQKMKDRLITAIVEAPEKFNHDPLATAARKRDVEVYCGIHFLSVCCFETACLQVAVNKGSNSMNQEDAILLLADEEEWQQVLSVFTEQPHINAIWKSLQRCLGNRMKDPCPRICDIVSIDPRYALDWDKHEQGRFCTKYVERLYLEYARKLEATLLKEEGYVPWVSYCQTLLKEPRTNWGEMGWLCERVSTMVIARGGVDISGELIITSLTSEMFFKIPDLRLVGNQLGCNSGVLYVPWTWNYARVDGVVIFRDIMRKLHMIGLQFTTSKKPHQHSEDEFLSVEVAGQWYPDIVKALASQELTLHYSFICLESETSSFKDGTLMELRSNVHFGVLPHWLHVSLFDEALRNRVTPEVLACLRNMASRREDDCKHLPVAQPHPPSPSPSSVTAGTVELTTAQLKRISRANLNKLATDLGMDPKKYPNIELLRDAMKAAGKIKVVDVTTGSS